MQMQFPDDEAMLHLKTFQFIAIFHMPLFFFLSGLVTRSTFAIVKDIANDLWRRFRVILVPSIVVCSLIAFYRGHTIIDFFEAHMKFGYWYLFVLFEMYLLNYLFSFFCNKVKHGRWIGELVIGVLIYVVLTFVYRHLPENVWHLLSFHKLVGCYPYFFFGVMAKRYNICGKLFTSDILYTISFLFLMIRLLFPQISFYRDDMVLCVVMIILIVGLFYRAEKKNSWLIEQLRYLGLNTLNIYILHGFIFSLANLTFLQSVLSVETTYSVLMEIAIGLVVAIPVTYLSLWLGKMIQNSMIIMKTVFNK